MSVQTHLDDVLKNGAEISLSARTKGVLNVFESNVALISGARFCTFQFIHLGKVKQVVESVE